MLFYFQLLKAKDEGRLVEMFGTGTAAIVSPVGNILYKDKMQSIPNSDDEKAISQRLVQIMYTRGGIKYSQSFIYQIHK